MYAFIIFGGASAWYLFYKYCCKKQTDDEELFEEEVEKSIDEADKADEADKEDISQSHKDASRLVPKKIADPLINDVVKKIEEKEELKSDHKKILNLVHKEFNDNYPKYLHHKVLEQLSSIKDEDEAVHEGEQVDTEISETESDKSIWNDLQKESSDEKPLFNSRLIYNKENIDANQVKYWFDKQGDEHHVLYHELVKYNGAFNVKRIDNDNGSYYFLLFASKEKQK